MVQVCISVTKILNIKTIFMKKVKLLFASAILFGFGINSANAQVKQRAENQHDRIHKGVKSGELTKKEAGDVREDQKDLRQDVNLAKSDGQITPGEKKIINKEENQNSREIYRLKHNGRERKPGTVPVKKRAENQQDRIQQGVKTGELTKKEATDVREDQKDLRQDVNLAKSDGKITAGERKTINKEEKQNSREIYRLKHNKAERKRAK